VRPDVVVVVPPALDHRTGLGQAGEDVLVQALVTRAAVKLSTKPFGCGLPGAM
jgi:hypothetical protein